MKYPWLEHYKSACDKRIKELNNHGKKYEHTSLTLNGIKHIQDEYDRVEDIVKLTKKDIDEEHFYRLVWDLEQYMNRLAKQVRKSLGMK